MELLKLSKFKIQLRTLVSDVRELRERERLATEQLHRSIQKQRQTEEEYGRKVQELQAGLDSSNEQRQKLERQVSYLQDDNGLLENKQKELKGTIQSLLQSRESFVNVYEESTCEMKQSIKTGDRKLNVLYEKINSHLLLFDSIEKEASSVKQVVDNVQRLVSEKEGVVAGLKSKMDKVTAFEKVFVEKICDLESKLKNNEDDLRRKNKIISELEAQQEAAKLSNNCRPQIQELQNTLSVKDVVIQNLISEKKTLYFEVGSLRIILQKIQDAVTNMNEEEQRVFSSILEGKEGCDVDTTNDNNRIEDAIQNSGLKSPQKASGWGSAESSGSLLCQEYNSVGNPMQENKNFNSCVSEFACSPPQSACSQPHSATNGLSISVNDAKDNGTELLHHTGSECSTTQAEASGDPG